MRLEDFRQDDDSYLWSLFLEGNDEAFRLIYEKHAKNLLLSGVQITNDYAIVEDCMHDLFMHLYTQRKTLSQVSNLKHFLFVSFRNRLYNVFKKDKKNLFDVHSDDNQDCISLSSQCSPESNLIEKEESEWHDTEVNRILSRLTVKQREVIHYRFYQSLSIKEIANIMQMNSQSVQNLLQRTIDKLKEVNLSKR